MDESIEEIFCFRYVRFYYLKLILYNLFTFGLLYIFCRIYRKLYLKVFFNPCDVRETEIFLVKDCEGTFLILNAKRENFFNKYKFLKSEISLNLNKNELKKNSAYTGEEALNDTDEQIILYYKNSKYMYLESIKGFASVQFDLTKFTNLEIYQNFSEGVKTIMEYNYLLNKYGENIMKMEDKTFSKIILKKFFTPLIIYRIFIVFIWIKIEYYSFLIVVLAISIALLLITSYQKYSNFKRIFNDNYLYEIPKMEEVIHLIFLCF